MSVNGKLHDLGSCNAGSIPTTPICKLYGSVVQQAGNAALSRRRSRVQVPSGSLFKSENLLKTNMGS